MMISPPDPLRGEQPMSSTYRAPEHTSTFSSRPLGGRGGGNRCQLYANRKWQGSQKGGLTIFYIIMVFHVVVSLVPLYQFPSHVVKMFGTHTCINCTYSSTFCLHVIGTCTCTCINCTYSSMFHYSCNWYMYLFQLCLQFNVLSRMYSWYRYLYRMYLQFNVLPLGSLVHVLVSLVPTVQHSVTLVVLSLLPGVNFV